jgi:hypothetical protein
LASKVGAAFLKSFRAPFAFCDFVFVAFGTAGFFTLLATVFFFAGRAAFGCVFFFADVFGFAWDFELFFFEEVAIFLKTPVFAGTNGALTKEHFKRGARGDFPVENEQEKPVFPVVYELALE